MEKYLKFRTIFILGCLLVSVKDAYKLGSLREGKFDQFVKINF